jgi:hypothetical protein
VWDPGPVEEEQAVTRHLYESRGRHHRRVLARTLAVIGAGCAAAGVLFVTGVVHLPHAAGAGAVPQVALVTPSPRPLRAVKVHRNQRATLRYRVDSHGQALSAVTILIRRLDGRIARSFRLGAQAPDKAHAHRFTATLKVGRYAWFVRATGADGVTTTSSTGRRLTVLAPLPPLFPDADAIARAFTWAKGRAGRVAVAVVDSHGVLHGYDMRRRFQSASLSKAMLLVAYLRRYPDPTAAMRATLAAMIDESDDAGADAVFGVVGDRGLLRVARLAGMTDFRAGASWIDAQVTAADQARFFYSYEQYLPRAAVGYARTLLSSIVPIQRWGIPAAAGPAGWKVFFKGGWLDEDGYPNRIVTQAAWLERGKVRWSLAVLTADDPLQLYGLQTQKGVTGVLLGSAPTSTYLAGVHEEEEQVSQ